MGVGEFACVCMFEYSFHFFVPACVGMFLFQTVLCQLSHVWALPWKSKKRNIKWFRNKQGLDVMFQIRAISGPNVSWFYGDPDSEWHHIRAWFDTDLWNDLEKKAHSKPAAVILPRQWAHSWIYCNNRRPRQHITPALIFGEALKNVPFDTWLERRLRGCLESELVECEES